jgi:mono/diheme cytochrome c family protein
VVDQVFNHNGSDVHFGPDGYLYMSMGDEGDWYNQRQNAQRIDRDFYSGLLRLDVDRKPANVEPNPHSAIATNGSGLAFYKIPINNPYVHTNLGGTWNGIYFGQTITNLGAVRGEFFATGLRHVWRFWIDPLNGEVWAGDVGQNMYEEVNIVTNGGNYGWAYYEGTTIARTLYPNEVNLPTNPPPGLAFPLYTYSHSAQEGDPELRGFAVIGGLIYRGSRLSEINGAYIFGDFPVGGASTIWALRRTNSSVVVQRLASDQGVAAFGVDPSNGDILIAAYGQNKVKRLVRGDVSLGNFPQKLSDTGVFADLATLAPNPGIVSYDPTIAFWSDYALKRRWFTIPDLTNTVTFTRDTNWTLPSGMKWIKHFDLELDRGNPNSPKRRLETRILVKTDSGNYGVSYKWNDAQDEAFLVDDDGDTFFVTITNGTPTNQLWEIPSRGGCLACHSAVGGHALTFHTREMNHLANLNGIVGSQIDVLSQAGYFSGPVPSAHTLPVYAKAGDTNASLEFRVRSYLAINCVQCHQPGGVAPSSWDARPYLTLEQTHLINSTLQDDGGNPANKVVVPGDLAHSVLWQRLHGTNSFGRMPPLATHQLDQTAIQLVASWINTELPARQTFAQWQVAWFGSTNNPQAAPGADPDLDGANNRYEFLTMTSPLTNSPLWKIQLTQSGTNVNVNFLRLANRGFLVENSLDFINWSPWAVPGNQIYFGASNVWLSISGPILPTNQFLRVQIFEP